MTLSRKMLMETMLGHFAWLESTHPSKASTPLARRARKFVKSSLKKSARR